jgi:hypothetical protein
MKTKHFAAAAIGLAILTGCAAKTMGRMNIDTNDIQYQRDDSTGLCFAFVGVGRGGSIVPEGLGMTEVPCTDKVMALIPGN